jgi:hypothetical protein
MTLMLDPCYKSLWVVQNYVGNGNAICLAYEHDMKEIPFFMIVFERLNLYIQAQVVVSVDGLPIEEDETNMFGVGAFVEKSSWALVTRELFLF